MADDPNKRGGADRRRVSQQPHEQAYQKRKGKEEGTASRSQSSETENTSGRSAKRGLAAASERTKKEVARKGGEASKGGGRSGSSVGRGSSRSSS